MTTDAAILSALRNDPDGASGADLARRLGISRAAVWARVEALRQLGYEIHASPHQGYQLNASPDLLHADDLMARQKGEQRIGRDIRVFQETSSTNDVVERLARDGVEEGVVVFAESQTQGRGRLGRKWVSPANKGLWFSVLLRPNCAPGAATQITVLAATSVARAIRRISGLPLEIKWPNDVLCRGRKLVGILTEMAAELDRVRHITLGIGVDVNLTGTATPPALRAIATSLREETGRAWSRPELAAALIEELDADYARLRKGAFRAIADEWEAQCSTLGQNVIVIIGSRRVAGLAEALDDDGALLLRTEHGHLERIVGGDVVLEK